MIRCVVVEKATVRIIVVALVAMMAASLVLGLVAGGVAHASTTFTVDSIGDGGDVNLDDSLCDASVSLLTSPCTLRAAIQEANDTSGTDIIRFNIPDDPSIPGLEVKTISPNSPLPEITDPVSINGYSQPGAEPNGLANGNNAALKIELNGQNAGTANGLFIRASNSTVRGLVINRFPSVGIYISGSGATGNKVEGNFIGTDASGTDDLSNSAYGVAVNAVNNTVGGTLPEARNVISGNGAAGVFIGASVATGNKVQGNFIGTEKDGTSALGNNGNGVYISGATNNTVGGVSGAANIIALNGLDGVLIRGNNTTGNSILRNSIFSNGSLGINLEGGTEGVNGATANDPDDPDTGPNNLQNKPVLSSAVTSGGSTTIQGNLNSTPSKTFVIRFFSNPSGNEGKVFKGQKNVTTNSNGNVSFSFSPANAVPDGQTITATATMNTTGDTSEFSAPKTVQ